MTDMSNSPIGKPMQRREDARFLTGAGQYTDDVVLPGQTYGVFLRSPHAHARIRSIDLAAAKAAPGVHAIFTGEDLAAAKVGGLPCGWLIHSKDGSPMKEPAHPVLAHGKVRHVGDPVALADEIFFFKRLIREAALRHDCFATFMAKPIEGEPGSAMHIHHSVVDKKTGKNIFSDRKGGETPEFLHFIAGMQTHLPAAVALLAPYVNSYRRYVPDFAAPINLEWGRDNRTTGLRVPISGPEARRLENRLAGMDCNPYLGIAASLACGYLGLKAGKMPRAECTQDAYNMETDLPYNLGDALDLLEEDAALREVLGVEFCNVYDSVKRNEYKEFLQVISPWEREHLLLNV